MQPLPITDLLLGTDVVSLARLQLMWQQRGDRLLARFLTQDELRYCQSALPEAILLDQPGRHLAKGAMTETTLLPFLRRAAARIAVKEAVAKALGVGINGFGYAQGLRWHQVSVLPATAASSNPNSFSKAQGPSVCLTGEALRVAEQQGVMTWRVSIAHDGDTALATVIGLVSGFNG